MIKSKAWGMGLLGAVLALAPAAWAADTDTTKMMAPAANSGAMSGAMSGANSFTEGQAKARIEDAGYSGVGELKKDDMGVWRGMASKNGQSVPVGLDFKGNVVAQ